MKNVERQAVKEMLESMERGAEAARVEDSLGYAIEYLDANGRLGFVKGILDECIDDPDSTPSGIWYDSTVQHLTEYSEDLCDELREMKDGGWYDYDEIKDDVDWILSQTKKLQTRYNFI